MMLRIIMAVFGAIELLFPRQLVGYMMEVTTIGEAKYEFKPWVYKLARLEGLAFILIALSWGRKRDKGS